MNRCFDDDDVQNSVKPFEFVGAAIAVVDGDDDVDDGVAVGGAVVAVAAADAVVFEIADVNSGWRFSLF